MPVSVSQPSKIAVSSSNGGVINISVVASEETKVVSLTTAAANNVSIAGAIGAGPAGATGPQGPQGETGPAGAAGQGLPTGGVEKQVIVKQSATDYDTGWGYVESVYLHVQNDEGSTLPAGTPVYAKGIQGNSILIGKADADDSSKMPAIGVLLEETTNGSSGEIITAGLFNKTVSGLTGVSVGDTVFVSNTGTLTTIKPTGASDLLQNIGIVLQTNGSNIQKMKVSAIDRTNDIPNLASGTFFLGGATGQISPYTLPISDGTNGQALVTNGNGALSFGDVDSVLTSGITISNNNNAFSHMTSPIAAGTSLEAILRDMLEKYNITSISLTSISRALQNPNGTYGSFVNDTNGETLEVGQGVRIQGFDYNIVDNTQTGDTSVAFLENNSTVESGFSDDNAAKTLTTTIERDLTSQSTKTYKVTAIDNGGGSNVTISSGTQTYSWYFRVRVGSSTTTSITSETASTLWNSLTAPFDNLIAQGDFTATADSGMDTQGKYTWIAYPDAWGTPNQILLDGSTNVLSDFESPVTFDLTNPYGVTTTYRFYRSTYDDAFAENQTVKVDF